MKKAGSGLCSEPGCPRLSSGPGLSFRSERSSRKAPGPSICCGTYVPWPLSPPFSDPGIQVLPRQLRCGQGPELSEMVGAERGEPQATGPERDPKCTAPAALFRLSETGSPWLFHFPNVPGLLILRDHIPSNVHRRLIPPALCHAPSLPLGPPHPLRSRLPTLPCRTSGPDPHPGSAGPHGARGSVGRAPRLVFIAAPGSPNCSPGMGGGRQLPSLLAHSASPPIFCPGFLLLFLFPLPLGISFSFFFFIR